jgi:hypothetical protein
MGTRRRLTTALAAAALALGGLAACGGEDEEETTVSVPSTTPQGATGSGGSAEKDAEKPASEANEEGAGAGLEQDISGADSAGTDTEAGQQGTIGDTTAE